MTSRPAPPPDHADHDRAEPDRAQPDPVEPDPVEPDPVPPAPRTAARLPPTPLIRPGDVGLVAWHLLVRDGQLVPLHEDVALPAHVRPTPALRAAALSPLVPARCAVARAAAVWVHVGGTPPGRVDVVAPPGARVPDPEPGRTGATASLPDADVVLLGGVRVTTPRRTAVDLLSQDPPGLALPLVARLRAAGVDAARVRADVAAASGRRGVRAAAALLPALEDAVAGADRAVGAATRRRPAAPPSRP